MRDRSDHRPTMGDIAEAAGVSQMTVSRVLRGSGSASAEARARVEQAAHQLGYVPNRLATALRDESTPLVAVILPTLGNRVFSEVLAGVTETLAGQGMQPVFGVTEYDPLREAALVRDLLSWRPRGIILPGLEHAKGTRAAIRASGVRVAEVMDLDGDPISVAFGLSQVEAGRATARHMLARGYRRFGWIGAQGGRDLRASKRLAGFRETVRAAGAQMVAERVFDGPSAMVQGRRGTAMLLDGLARPDAIYFANDDLAAGGLMHCLAEGLTVPRDVALAGFNGLGFLEALPVRLTTVETPRREMGISAARHVMGDGPVAEAKVDLGFRLVAGETS
ncbi:LacI family DNA-binding transcriptional regulator [Mesobacterium pallidum]|uniref:LacI family DNA-binding transcriptional regulator n=1 Tax=Mesobacterium pallidum TaxID=2872037 RepID=UPI001EE18A20|nr:LacI family DNA-binding transcriptional regulator [Mesobacterium pallidum]